MLLLAAGIAAASGESLDGGRDLAATLGRKLRCAARGPGPCWRNPLTEAYGRPVAGLVRALAPSPATRVGPRGGHLYPVDFRYCRRESCALPGERSPKLTASNRRTTAFVSVDDRRRADRALTVTYWLYRPTLGWQRLERKASSEDVARHAKTPLGEDQVPALVPLETLAGRNHYQFPAREEPPWRWHVEGRYPG
jgi:hypothetical protein